MDEPPGAVSESTSRINQQVDAVLRACEKATAARGLAAAPHPSVGDPAASPRGRVEWAEQAEELLRLLGAAPSTDRRTNAAATGEPTRSGPALPPLPLSPTPMPLSRRQREKARAAQLLTPSPRTLAALNARVAQYHAEAQAEQARHGCKIAENIRRAREYRRPRKAPVPPPQSPRPASLRSPRSTLPRAVQDPLVAAAWSALIVVAEFPARLATAVTARYS